MERIESLQHTPTIGEEYNVPCVEYMNKIVPVIGKAHSDAVLGPEASKSHIHIDLRFVEDSTLIHIFSLTSDKGYINATSEHYVTIFAIMTNNRLPILRHTMKCLRHAPRYQYITITTKGKLIYWKTGVTLHHFRKFEDIYENKKVKIKSICKRCPHQGVPLGSTEIIDGIVTCPGHMLDWDATTGAMIRRSKYSIVFGSVDRTKEERKKQLDLLHSQAKIEKEGC